MKSKALLLLSTASLLHAGAPGLETTLAPKPEPWIKPVIDIRARYEFADVDGFDRSNAVTIRERLGLQTQAWNGFSVLIEGEFSQAAVDDYNGGAVGANPFDPKNSLIADPETNELNQAYLQYSGFDTTAKVGRQRIIYDNWEYDSVLTKKFNDNFTALAKVAQFETNGDAYTGGSTGPKIPTITRFSVELDYTF